MKTFKVKSKFECPYILGDYCNHSDGPILCQGEDWPDDCPGETIEGGDDKNWN